jgi:hypothetical protein
MQTPKIDITGVQSIGTPFYLYPKYIGYASGSGIASITYKKSFSTGYNFITYVTIDTTSYVETTPIYDFIGKRPGVSGNYSFIAITAGDNIRYSGISTGKSFTGFF